MKPVRVLATLALGLPVLSDQMFLFSARGRIYEIITRRIGTILTLPGHWMYQPSVITPSALTGGDYLLLFSSNLVPGGDINKGEAIFLSRSSDGYSHFTAPTPVLSNTLGVEDLCDFGDARPIWDGSVWHVYVYAVHGDYRSNKCDPNAGIFEATGPTLDNLAWVTYPGTNQARPLLSGQGAPGITEDMQWFLTPSPGGPSSTPLLVTYFDWGALTGNVSADVSDGSPDLQNWYQTALAVDPGGTFVLPDAVLGQTADAATLGNPAVGFESGCVADDGRYQYPRGIAFYDNLDLSSKHPLPAERGVFFTGPLESVSSDEHGPRMFRPRLARDEHGYILPLPDAPGLPHTWQSFLYYNDAQVGNQNGCGYTRWFDSDQRLSVSYIEIREQPDSSEPSPVRRPRPRGAAGAGGAQVGGGQPFR